MWISIRTSSGRRCGLYVPLLPLQGILGSRAVCRAISSHGDGTKEITPQQMRALIKALREGKKAMNGQPLVDVEAHGGDRVKIRL